MGKDNLIAFFRSLTEVNEKDEALIRSQFNGIRIPARTYIVQEGEVSHSLYFTVEGCARIGINCPTGEEISCYFAQEGEWMAEYSSFLTGQPSQYFIQTLEDCNYLMVDRMGLETIFEEASHGTMIARKVMELMFLSTLDRLTDFYRLSPEERFQKFLAQYPNLSNRIPQQYLASYIGVKPQSLSRIKKRAFSS